MNSKKKLILTLSLFTCIFANGLNPDDTPRIVLALGRFHPLILHLPIGALLLTFFIDIYGRIKNNYQSNTIKLALGFSAFFAIIACILGYFLSLEDGYAEETLNIHFWGGIVTAAQITLLFFLSYKQEKLSQKLFLPIFILTIIGITITGHYGSILTHGDKFLTEYMVAPKEEKTIEIIDSLQIYNNVVLKIFEDKCIQCHNSTKKKGELSLVSKEAVLKGGESGDIIKFGDVNESLLYKHIHLPIEDKKHMPPEGKPQLTKDEIWLLKYWINNSKIFDEKVVDLNQNDTLNKLLKNYLVLKEIHIEEANLQDIQAAEDVGFSIKKLVPNRPELWVTLNKKDLSKSDIKKLASLKDQVVELNLSNSALTDDISKPISQFKNLKKIDLSNTSVSDKTLSYLEGLKMLEVLNIVNTKTTNQGLENLFTQIQPQQVYAWNSGIDEALAKKIAQNYKSEVNVGTPEGFAEAVHLKPPTFSTQKSLFTDTLTIDLKSKLKGSKIYYTLNGVEPDSTSLEYTNPFVTDSTTHIAIKVFKKGWLPSETLRKEFLKVGHQVLDHTIIDKPESNYSGTQKLFDLELGTVNFKDGKWTGFLGYNINTTANLGSQKTLNKVTVNCLSKYQDWILFPIEIIVSVSNNEKNGFKEIGTLKINEDNKKDLPQIKKFTLDFPETTAQYLKIIVKNPGILPSWHEGAGNASWIFVDEIIIN